MTIGVTSWSKFSSQAGTMSIVNIVPLLCGPRLLLITKMLGISLQTQYRGHRWIGQIAVSQALIHSILSVTRNLPFKWNKVNRSGIIGGSALGLLFLLSLNVIRRRVYEFFKFSHLLLTAVFVVAISMHLASKKPIGRLILQIGMCIFASVTAIHGILFAIRNVVRGKSFAVADVQSLPNAIHVKIQVPREWQVEAGQYIFLTIPSAGFRYIFQSHPLMITWWQRDAKGLTISLLVKPRRGFTGVLGRLSDKGRLAFIDGPYGVDYNLGEFGTVLMFASGIGIAGHLSFLKEILSGYNNCVVRTRRIVLIWQLDQEYHQQWIKTWMDEMIEMDTGYILKIVLHVLNRSLPTVVSDVPGLPDKFQVPETKPIKYGTHDRIQKFFHQPRVANILKEEFASRKGKMAVSVCTNKTLATEIREEVQQNMDRSVRLVELDFRPSLRGSSRVKTSRVEISSMNFQCMGP